MTEITFTSELNVELVDYMGDPHARIALAAYAVDCAPHYPKLAEDLRKVLQVVSQ